MAPQRCRQSQIRMRPAGSQLHNDPARGQSTRGAMAASNQRAAGVQGLAEPQTSTAAFPPCLVRHNRECVPVSGISRSARSNVSRLSAREWHGQLQFCGCMQRLGTSKARGCFMFVLLGRNPGIGSLAVRFLSGGCPRPAPLSPRRPTRSRQSPVSSLVVVRAGLHLALLCNQPPTGPAPSSPSPQRGREVPKQGCMSHSS
jgi:hypothetical protein